MKKTEILLLLLSLLLAACNDPGFDIQTGVHLQASFTVPETIAEAPMTHETMDYLLYLPDGYTHAADESWPLIMFLHGSGSDSNDAAFVMSAGLPEVLYKGDQPDDFPFIVVSPQAFPGLAWWDPETMLILGSLLDEVIEVYRVDTSRLYLTGLSMGGYGSWWVGTVYSDRFAAIVSTSGSGYRTNQQPQLQTLCQLKNVPIWAFHGAQDQISEPAASRIFVDTLADSCDGNVRWTLYEDAGHFGTYERAYRDPELYEWLLSHQIDIEETE